MNLLIGVLLFNAVPYPLIEKIAIKRAYQKYGVERILSTLTYYGGSDKVSAYAFVFPLKDDFSIERDSGFGIGRFATVVVSSDSSQIPILETFNCLPRYYTSLDKAKEEAEKILGRGAKFERVIYKAPLEEWFEFSLNDKRVLINSYSFKINEPEEILPKMVRRPSESLLKSMREKWNKISNSTVIEKGYIDSVPALLWSYGCSPTASAMIMWYWDMKGYGRLVDYFFDRYDQVKERKVFNLPNVQRELAKGMRTDSMSGSTAGAESVYKGHLYVANHLNSYAFESEPSPYGEEANNWVFDWIKEEIDAGRPCHWAVFHYFPEEPWVGHSLCAMGYEITSIDTMVIVHTTWDTAVHHWPLWVMIDDMPSYDWVVTVVPGGADNNGIKLLSPEDGEIIPAGLPYRIRWESNGGDIDHIGIQYALSDKEVYPIASFVPDEGSYVWRVTENDLSARINIKAYDAQGMERAGDGTRRKIKVRELFYTGVIIPLGHCNLPGEALDVYKEGRFAYVASGIYGFSIVDVSDPTLPSLIINYPCDGYVYRLCVRYPYLYLANGIEGLRIFNISDLYNPKEVSRVNIEKMSMPRDYGNGEVRCIEVRDSFAYLGVDDGLYIVNISDPSEPSIIGNLKTGSRVDALSIIENSIYLGCGGQKIIIADITNPLAPKQIDSINTQGPIMDMRFYKGWLYIAETIKGVEIWSPDTSFLLDIEGQAQKVYLSDDYLYIADGYGGVKIFDIVSPMLPEEVGEMEAFDRGKGVFAKGHWALLADGTGGLLSFANEAVGIKEIKKKIPKLSLSISPNPSSSNAIIKYNSPEPGILTIYNATGRALFDFKTLKGTGKISLKGKEFPCGVYFVRLETKKSSYTEKLILIK